MIFLSLEFSSPVRGAAILQAIPGESAPVLLAECTDEGNPAIKPVQLVERALSEADADRNAIEGVAVGLGPGSYTGIRTAIAFAQGWQLAAGISLWGLSSVECLVAQAHANGWFGRVLAVVDAQRGEVYLGAYDLREAGWKVVEPLRIATVSEVKEMLHGPPGAPPPRDSKEIELKQSATVAVGPEVTRWFPNGRLIIPPAGLLGRLCYARRDQLEMPGEKMEPIYLRPVSFVKAPPPRPLPE